MNRYTVWACFGVDAESPEQAKEVVNLIVSPEWAMNTSEILSLQDDYRINATVFISPTLDKMFGEGIDDEASMGTVDSPA